MLKNEDYLRICRKNVINFSELIHMIISEGLCIDACNDEKILQRIIDKNLGTHE